MGDVYLMRHVMLDCHVALKVIRRAVAEEPQFIERFRREGRAMAMLDHPRIARVMDFGKAEDRYYLETQYMNGGSLRDKLRDGPLRRSGPWPSPGTFATRCSTPTTGMSPTATFRRTTSSSTAPTI